LFAELYLNVFFPPPIFLFVFNGSHFLSRRMRDSFG
jgi:hypothetical protein